MVFYEILAKQVATLSWWEGGGRGSSFLSCACILIEVNMLLRETLWMAPCLKSQVLVLKVKKKKEKKSARIFIVTVFFFFFLEHNHWIAKDNSGRHRPGDLSGFSLDHDLINRVHQTGLLWVVLVHTPCFHRLLSQPGHPWDGVSPHCAPLQGFYLWESQNNLRKSFRWRIPACSD